MGLHREELTEGIGNVSVIAEKKRKYCDQR